MRFQHSDGTWIVWVKKSEFPLARGRSNVPSEFTIGSINDRTGSIDAYGLPYGLATQSRKRPDPEIWAAAARVKLKEAVDSGALDKARREYRREEKTTGDFIVKLSNGSRNAFHTMPLARAWATTQLENMRPGARAEFFRGLLPGVPREKQAYVDEPFAAMERDAYGHIKHASIRPAVSERPRQASGDYTSSRPWIAYARTLGVPRLLGRFSNPVSARDRARDERGFAKHISELDPSIRLALGLRG
jgi:hypothetical protein